VGVLRAPLAAGPSWGRPGALTHRAYRRFLGAQVAGSVGTWMQGVTLSWLVLEQTGSAVLVGLVVAAQNLPVLVAGPLGGLVADRFARRRVLVVTQGLFALPALAVSALATAHAASAWAIVALALLWGRVQVVDLPSRQAVAIELVGRDHLVSAIACNASAWHAASIVGPAIAGAAIGVAGPLPSLLGSCACSLVAIALLLRVDGAAPAPGPASRRDHGGVAEAVRHVRGDPILRSLLPLVAVFSLFAMNRLTLVPLMADQVLRVGAAGFGFLLATSGVGALAGGVALAVRGRPIGGGTHLGIGLVWAAALLGFSVSRQLWLSAGLITVVGVGQEWFMAAALMRIQVDTPDHLRGRVLAFYGQALTGTGPIGAALAGLLAALAGPALAMAAGAVVAGSTALLVRLLSPATFSAGSAPLPGTAPPAPPDRPPASAGRPPSGPAIAASPPPAPAPARTAGRPPPRL
jgi:MFS family permease